MAGKSLTVGRTFLPVGFASSFEFALVFAQWADSRGGKVDCKSIMARFGVHRATAYRWITAWNDANARVMR